MEGEKGTKNETTDIIKHKPYIQAGHGINLQLYDINNCRSSKVSEHWEMGNGKAHWRPNFGWSVPFPSGHGQHLITAHTHFHADIITKGRSC